MTLKVKLSDVANEARVSIAAASKVLHGGNSSVRVGKDARQRILDAAQKLHYVPNVAAAVLAGGRSRMVGILMDSRGNYRQRQLLAEQEEQAVREKYRLMIEVSHDDPAEMTEACRTMFRYGADGILVLSHDYPDALHKEELFSNPEGLVFFEPFPLAGAKCVRSSRFQALRALIGELKAMGKTRIALRYGYPKSYSEKMLLAEFRKAMEENGLCVDEKLIISSCVPRYDAAVHGKEIVEKLLLPEHPQVLILDDAEHAVAVQSRLLASGWKLPEDLLIIGLNGDPLFGALTPPVYTMNPDYQECALRLFRMLVHPEQSAFDTPVETIFSQKDFHALIDRQAASFKKQMKGK